MKQLFFLISFLISLPLYAIDVTGRIVNSEDGKGIDGATIALMTKDSKELSQNMSRADGSFTVKLPKAGDYTLHISFIGFKSCIINIDNSKKDLALGQIDMTPSTTQIEEVTVEAKGYTKVDRQIIFPSNEIVATSFNSIEMLSKMMLPGLIINVANNSIGSMDKRGVQLRINNAEVTADEYSALDPKKVQRVEYIDMPGQRYGDVAAVINIITKKVEDGVSFGGNAQAAVTTPYTNDQVFLKYNNKNSEFGINYRANYNKYNDKFSDETLTLLLPEKPLTLSKEGIKAPSINNSHNLALTYNYYTNKTIFNAVFRNKFSRPKDTERQSIIDDMNNVSYSSLQKTKERNYTPSLDLYFEHHITPKQTIALNTIGTLISTDYSRGYKEFTLNENIPTNDFAYTTDGKKRSLKSEAIYENNLSMALSFSAGLQNTIAYTKNVYKQNSKDLINSMHNSETYGFTQLSGMIGKFGYQVGVGIAHQYFKEGNSKYSRWDFRPKVTLSYMINDKAILRNSFYILGSMPGLTQMSDFEQWQNPYELYIGNANLVPTKAYANNLFLTYRTGRFTISPMFYYQRTNNFVENVISMQNGESGSYIEYRKSNQKYFQHIQGQLNITWEIIKKHLTLSANGIINNYRNHGLKYRNNLTKVFGIFGLEGYYKNWSLSASYAIKSKVAFGEAIQEMVIGGNISLKYKYKHLQYGLTVLNPFMPDGTPSKSVLANKVVQKHTASYIRNEGNQVRLSLAWNFDFGKKFKNTYKQTSIYGDDESGVVK